MYRNLLIAAMLATTVVSLAPSAVAWTCVSTSDWVCEPVNDTRDTVNAEIDYQDDCVTADDGVYATADCSLHGALPGHMVCYGPLSREIC